MQNISFCEVDLRDSKNIENIIEREKPTRIVNFAAVGVAPGNDSIDDFIDINIKLPGTIYQTMSSDCKFLNMGSMSEYVGNVNPLKEDITPRFYDTLYAWSKNAADTLLESLSNGTSKPYKWCVRVRLFGTMGPGEAPHRLLPTVVNACLKGKNVPLSDGAQVRDLLYIDDVVRALWHFIGIEDLGGKAINLGRGEGISVRKIASRAGERLGKQELLCFGKIPRRPGENDIMVADVERLNATGWKPRLSLNDSIDRTVDHLVKIHEKQRMSAL
jgi:GDP-4-dehydro-6-deoxy-D-mannose reductase